MPRDLLGKIQRGLRKPPRYILSRLFHEAISKTEVIRGPRRARALTDQKLTRFAGVTTLEELWEKLASRPYVAEPFEKIDADAYETMCPGDTQRILDAAARALAHRVELMGSGDVDLGEIIDWHRDYKVGQNWPPTYWSSIDYNNPDRPSDVKFPWELSRVQWLIPCGQAYALTGDESYAECARNVLDHWIDENPYASSINWACTMEVALRILTWSCLFHFFKRSDAWSSREFRGKFLRSLYLHADFTRRHLEKSDINGNHYTADAAGLVFAAAFFGAMGDAETWGKLGWTILLEELPLQVFPDGVDFEASVPYHRLVQELFLLPALYRTRIGESVPQTYLDRLEGMARFTASYSRDDGSTPYWGDADDARSLPFGFQGLNDHRYLLALSAALLENDALRKSFSGSRTEAAWLLGLDATSNLPDEASSELKLSKAFRDGGFFVPQGLIGGQKLATLLNILTLDEQGTGRFENLRVP
ncbi:MAG: heparinase II/III family protein, partial [Planctomycetota bacterium]